MRDRTPLISVVIPVRNEEAHLGTVLQGLLDQEYPKDRFEIIVADGNSTDGTAKVVEKIASISPTRIELFANPVQRSSAGRNVGVQNSSGELIVFVDGHCHIPSKTFLQDAARLFEETGADCLCRPQPLETNGNSFFQKGVAQARATALGHGRDSSIYNLIYEGPVNPSSAGAFYRRTVFERVGLYDENFDAAEDVEFNYRVFKSGLASYISPRLAIEYQPRSTLQGLWRQMARYGKGRCRLVRKHPHAFSLSQLAPTVLLLWLVLGGAVSLVASPFFLIYAFSLALYAAAIAFFSLGIAYRHGLALFFITPAIFATIHLGLGAGFLAETLRWKRANRAKAGALAPASRTETTL
jgi:glycosyltransferase involved in cell wall biosynthesis